MNTINREKIISDLAIGLKEVSFVYAFWLEGSDGTNTVDEYSDIDICIDVEDGEENNVFSIMFQLPHKVLKLMDLPVQ